MNSTAIAASPSTLREWSSFLSNLNEKKYSAEPLIRGSGSPAKIIGHLEKQLKEDIRLSFRQEWYTVQKVKRKPAMPGQLTMILPDF